MNKDIIFLLSGSVVALLFLLYGIHSNDDDDDDIGY